MSDSSKEDLRVQEANLVFDPALSLALFRFRYYMEGGGSRPATSSEACSPYAG
ncbi:MAG TPA: hypothetical protein PLQ49_04640 [Methanothrix sp.]|nr:hypothetical protein [Methanothrix sp.]